MSAAAGSGDDGTAVGGADWEIDDAGIGWITFRPPAGRPPLVGTGLLAGLDAAMDALEPARAIVLRSPAPSSFLLGVDLDELLALSDPAAATARAREGQRVLRRLETLPAPTFAAIRGACLGAGVEVALACAYRLAADEPGTRLAFPEVRHRMVPGLGGTVRLPRLLGLEVALDLIVGGRSLSPADARQRGLVDALLPPEPFEPAVRGWVLERLEQGRMRTGARRRVPRRLLEDTAPGRRFVAARAARRLLTDDTSPAGRAALDLVLEGLALPLDRAFQREAEVAGELLASDTARGMIHAARGLAAAERGRSPAYKADRVGVLLAGPAGAEWVHLLVTAGVAARLRDSRRDRLADTTRRVLQALAMDIRDGRITEGQADRRSASITPSTGFGGFGTLDAVLVGGDSEDTLIEVLREAEDHTSPDCLLCCTTLRSSTADLQPEIGRPERLVRLIAAPSPDRFPVVEVAPGPETAPAALEQAVGLARQLGLTPLMVGDAPGGAISRLLGAYIGEALRLAGEGFDPAGVDRAMEEFGFSVGPVARAEGMGQERAMTLLRDVADRSGDRFSLPPRAPAPQLPPAEPIRARILMRLVNEGAMILEERVLASAGLIDAAAVLALGFPRRRGGLFRYADSLGLAGIADSLDELRDRLGTRFEAAPLLRRLAHTGGSFTGHSPPAVL